MDVYLTHTPYHILLSLAIAYNKKTETNYIDNHLFIIGDFNNSAYIYEKLKGLSLMDRVRFLPGNYNSNPVYEAIILKKNTYTIQKLLKKDFLSKNTKSSVFVFNDRRPEDQLLMYLNKKHGGINYYVEDGMAIYADMGGLRSISSVERILRKLYFGFWYSPVDVLGTSKYIDVVLANEPSLVRDIIKTRHPVLKINKKIFDNFTKLGILERIFMLDNLIKDKITSSKKVALILVPHLSALTEEMKREYCKYINNTINHLLQENYEILIKYHPRETLEDIMRLCSMLDIKNILTIPRNIPIEVLYFLLKTKKNVVIYGFPSSAILTARLILGLDKTKKIISFWNDSFNLELKRVLRKLDISLINTNNLPRQNF